MNKVLLKFFILVTITGGLIACSTTNKTTGGPPFSQEQQSQERQSQKQTFHNHSVVDNHVNQGSSNTQFYGSEDDLTGSHQDTGKPLWIWIAPQYRKDLPDGTGEYLIETI